MSALENARKLSREDVLEKIAALDMHEYGLCRDKLSECFERAMGESREEKKKPGVVAALDNADTSGVLLEILKKNPGKVLEGVAIAAYALGAEKKVLNIPEFASGLEEEETIKAAAEKFQVEVEIGIVDKRTSKGSALIHIVTAENLSDAFSGNYNPGIYVSVDDGELDKMEYDVKIADLVDAKSIKALQIGYRYYLPEAAEKTVEAAHIDNGVIRTLTERDCIVAETEKRLIDFRKQSCGKCVFCREGLLQLQYIQKEIAEGRGKAEYVDLTEEIGEAMTFSCLCTVGGISPQIALSAVKLFDHEYAGHIKRKKCLAGVCFSAETIYIDPKLCTGCGECIDVCPKDCIEGKNKYIHMIDDFDCDKCGKCMEVCEADAIVKIRGKVPKLPNRLTKVGRFKR